MRYNLNVTNKCNWNCSYCITDVHNMKKRPLISIIEDIRSLEDGCEITLSGGEPGLLSEEDILSIFKELDSKKINNVDLTTNGKFIENYPHLLDKFSTIHYHCVESLRDEIEFFGDYDYTIIVTEEEFPLLEDFLKKYPEIQFSIIGARLYNPITMKTKLSMIRKYKSRMTQRSISENLEEECLQIGYKR